MNGPVEVALTDGGRQMDGRDGASADGGRMDEPDGHLVGFA